MAPKVQFGQNNNSQRVDIYQPNDLATISVPEFRVRLFSQSRELSYILQAKDLRRHYGLKFVTSSLERKAEVGKIKAKLEQDSSRVPTRAMEASNCDDDDEQIIMQACAAYEIAASAASYVQSRAKSEEEMSCSRVYKSEVAAYMAASTVTAVVAAGEREKQEAAKDLQSLHSSPCEWFVCDDSTTYTRRFVIQVPTLLPTLFSTI